MTELEINDNNIDVFMNCEPLTVTKLTVLAPNNVQMILDNLYKFENLLELRLSNNQLTEMRGLDKLVKLKLLDVSNNQISDIKGTEELISLLILNLNNNQVKKLDDIDNMVFLEELLVNNNSITELPLCLCNLRKCNYIEHENNPLEFVSLPIQRWKSRLSNKRTTL